MRLGGARSAVCNSNSPVTPRKSHAFFRLKMPSKNKPLTDAELEVYEAGRDLAADILQSISEMKAGQVKSVDTSAIEARMKTGLSQSKNLHT